MQNCNHVDAVIAEVGLCVGPLELYVRHVENPGGHRVVGKRPHVNLFVVVLELHLPLGPVTRDTPVRADLELQVISPLLRVAVDYKEAPQGALVDLAALLTLLQGELELYRRRQQGRYLLGEQVEVQPPHLQRL